ncbi:MAG: B12-binding domain-containing radical SAM protein [Clostridia bacterium]|nr:B12-binding domain-containing radical SAM protein [Clostridia bacterium]
MLKILLINSPIFDKKLVDKEDYLPPLGLGYIATNLEELNYDVEIIDAVYNNYTVNEILTIIEQKKPTAVGLNIFSINFNIVKNIIENCQTKTMFMVGGKSTRTLYRNIMDFSTINTINVIIGEGELITSDIITDTVKEKPLISYNGNNTYLVNNESCYFPKNLDKSILDRKFFENREILNKYGKIEEAIVTSRECVYNCAFCGGARNLNMDISVRTRSPESIIIELQQIQTLHPKTQSIRILDDLFLKDRNSILTAIEIFKNFNYEFRATSHILSLKNSEDLLPSLLNSGCRELEIGIESGSDKIRKSIHKSGTIEDVKKVIKSVLDAGINVKGYFMFGLPGETEADCLMTYELAKKLHDYSMSSKGKFQTSAFQFRPYHGTEIYNKLNIPTIYSLNENLNILKGRQQFNFSAGNFSLCDTKTLEKFVIITNNLNKDVLHNEYLKEM